MLLVILENVLVVECVAVRSGCWEVQGEKFTVKNTVFTLAPFY